jgi:hypothetical protein
MRLCIASLAGALALALAGTASATSQTYGNDSGTVTSVVADGGGHLTVTWALACTGPSSFGDGICPVDNFESLAALSVCVSPVGDGSAGCPPNGTQYFPPLFSNNATYTTPDAYPPGRYQVSVSVDDILSFYPNPSPISCPQLYTCSDTAWMPWYPFTIADTQAPTMPANIHGTANRGGHGAVIVWDISTDNVGVVGYRVYRDGTLVRTVAWDSGSTGSIFDTGLTPKTTYQYQVAAIDEAGNASPTSDPVTVTTSAVCHVVVVAGHYTGKKPHRVWHRPTHKTVCA